MDIFVVMDVYDCEFPHIIGVFSTVELAKKKKSLYLAEHLSWYSPDDVEILIIELDDMKDSNIWNRV